MEKLRFVLLAVDNNDYQVEQVSAAQSAAARLGIELEIIHTEHDSIQQSQIVLDFVQRPAATRPNAIFFEPVGTSLAQPARAAAAAKVGWVILNRENVDYVRELRERYSTPMFSVTTDHKDVGEIQGEQVGRLLPKGGAVLYIEGPGDNNAAVRRTEGMLSRKPANVEVRTLRGRWTEVSAYNAVNSWLKLSIAKEIPIGVVAAQNDAMALGARKAFHELPNGPVRDRWLQTPFLGCDGLPNGGQKAVREHHLAATVVIPPNAGDAVEAMVAAIRSGKQPDVTLFTQASSFPPLHSLSPVSGAKH
ncbi:MAG TPA: substrate-binding domain-containing protein [Terriglobales bacterium]|nr:substrate-binding domain-containing protein [Terriglobales bacterium]